MNRKQIELGKDLQADWEDLEFWQTMFFEDGNQEKVAEYEDKKKEIEKEIQELTGWNKNAVRFYLEWDNGKKERNKVMFRR